MTVMSNSLKLLGDMALVSVVSGIFFIVIFMCAISTSKAMIG